MPDTWYSADEGIDNFEDALRRMETFSRDMREPLGRTQDHIQRTIELQFATEGMFQSGGWEPLSEDYELSKVADGFLGGILERTGVMMGIMESDSSWDMGDDFLEFRPPSEKAGWHQSGVPGRRSRTGTANPLPARPMLDLHEEDFEMIEEFFDEWIQDVIRPIALTGPGSNTARGPGGRFVSRA